MTEHNQKLQALAAEGQSIWLDNITRDLVQQGKLQLLIADGLRGITSNPSIFHKAMSAGHAYDSQIAELAAQGKSPEAIYESLTVTDIQGACDRFRPLYDELNGTDGFVSIEVSPKLAHDTQGSIAEARRLWQAVNRPNLMVKIPGTLEGSIAIRQSLTEGINTNITLLFSLRNHERVMEAYLDALEYRVKIGQPIKSLASVASFFVSRVDALTDKLIEAKIAAARTASDKKHLRSLLGKLGIANAKLAYAQFQRLFESDRFSSLRLKGVRVQRPLWASTSTKNPAYRDVMYVEALIGPDTVNTVPDSTLAALEDHAQIQRTVDTNLRLAQKVVDDLNAFGIDYDAVTRQLETEGIQKFAEAYDEAIGGIRTKLAQVR